jgi:broad specificity phosphatase PhoE
LRRAYETASIIVGGLRVHADARLAEIHHGSWQGKTKQDIADRWPHEWAQWNKLPTQFTPPGGEPAGNVRSRVEDFLHNLDGTHILCVSHGVIIQTFLSVLLDMSPDEYVPANGSAHTFVFRNNQICDYRIDC